MAAGLVETMPVIEVRDGLFHILAKDGSHFAMSMFLARAVAVRTLAVLDEYDARTCPVIKLKKRKRRH